MPGTTPVGLRVCCECSVPQSLMSVRFIATRYLVLRSARQILSCFSAPGTVMAPMLVQLPPRSGGTCACAEVKVAASSRAVARCLMGCLLVAFRGAGLIGSFVVRRRTGGACRTAPKAAVRPSGLALQRAARDVHDQARDQVEAR